jgi:hypothetical protein
MSEPIECRLCAIELGEGHHKCRRAEGTDICLDCALLYDGPTPEEIDDEMERRLDQSEGALWRNAETPFVRNY